MLQLQDIPFKQFKKWLVDKDASIFIVEGNEEQPEQTAERLHIDYLDSTKTRKALQAITIENNLLFNWYKVQTAQELIDALNEFYSEKLASLLRKLYSLPLTEESYKDDLKKIATKNKRYKIDFERYQAEKEKLNKANGADTAKNDYKYYSDVTNAIGKMQGYHIPADIDTQSWCGLFVELVNTIDSTTPNGESIS